MSALKKLQGGTDSELTRLKALWRGLEESAREFWRSQFIGPATQAATRQLLKSRTQISLASDNQLNRFRDWLADEDLRQRQADKMEANESRITAEHPEWAADQVRDEVIKAAYYETLASGNFCLGLKTAKVDLAGKQFGLDSRRLALLEKKAAQADSAKGILENKELSEAQKRARMHELFGLA